mmetsp:Transcript_8993/g.13133  ORF Transcript_8993/g.13133 Transcript_8993/m.13133 type:complete len:89 (+) Transcript_8993:19-285(+)
MMTCNVAHSFYRIKPFRPPAPGDAIVHDDANLCLSSRAYYNRVTGIKLSSCISESLLSTCQNFSTDTPLNEPRRRRHSLQEVKMSPLV